MFRKLKTKSNDTEKIVRHFAELNFDMEFNPCPQYSETSEPRKLLLLLNNSCVNDSSQLNVLI